MLNSKSWQKKKAPVDEPKPPKPRYNFADELQDIYLEQHLEHRRWLLEELKKKVHQETKPFMDFQIRKVTAKITARDKGQNWQKVCSEDHIL